MWGRVRLTLSAALALCCILASILVTAAAHSARGAWTGAPIRSQKHERRFRRRARLPARTPNYLRVRRGGARNSRGDYPYDAEDEQYYGHGSSNTQQQQQQQPPPPYYDEDAMDDIWNDWEDPGMAGNNGYRPQRSGRVAGSRRRGGRSSVGSSSGMLGGIGSVGTVLTQGDKKTGLMCIAASVALSGLGVTLFFNKFLIRLGNIMLVIGAVLLVGPSTAVSYFSQRSKLRGTCIFALGFFLVFMGWPIFGLLCELFGFLNLFGNMLPLLMTMARQLPYVGPLIPGPRSASSATRKRQHRRSSSSGYADPPPPPPADFFDDAFDENDGGYQDYKQQQDYGW